MTAVVDRSTPDTWLTRVAGHPVPTALRACWHAARGLTVVVLALAVARGIAPNLLYVGTSALAAALANARDDATLAVAIGVVTGLFFLVQIGEPVAEPLANALGRRVETDLQRSVIVASLTPPTIAHLETDTFREAMTTARDWENTAHPPAAAVNGLVYLVTAGVWAGVSGLFLIQFIWWAPLIVMGGWLTMTLWGTRFREVRESAQRTSATTLRRAVYYRDLAFEGPSARESRIFGLADWLRGHSDDHWRAGMARIWDARSATRSLGIGGVAVLVLGYLLLFALIMQAAFSGTIDVAHATLYVQACGGIAYLWMPWAVLALKESTGPIRSVVGAVGRPARPTPGRDPAGMPHRTIAFRNVAFTYPGQPSPVYDDLDLVLRAGESIAIVGANGAGKTTLVKLLCGLLDVDRGTVLVDDVALMELDRAAWEGRVAAIFQDFVRYPFSARENVALGRTAASPDALDRALDRAMAGPAIADLPDGLETPLSRDFGGVDLSGGQWQRIALARAMYAVERGASVLILDEPTAHLDIRAEAELFDRFLELTRGLTTVLISHRFSSVRHAQRIVVLERGRIVEDGTHPQLVAAGGLYATMFREQAQHFTDQ
jgi:ATP-binding cassette subfamily B protein